MNPQKKLPYQNERTYTEEQKTFLAPYLSDSDSDIFVLKNLDGIVGAAFARYSRQKGGVKDTLLELVVNEKLDPVKSTELMERILIQYGDDSVGELEGAHLALENISNLATKEIEDRRIGGSPIEQSTRYVVYDQRDINGNYPYYRDDTIINSEVGELYIKNLDRIFDIYCELQEPVKNFLSTKKPLEEAEYDIMGKGTKQKYSEMSDEKLQKDFKRTYNIDLKTKTCDILRVLLPAATLSNVGLFGNGRFYQYLLSHLYTNEIPEMKAIAQKAHTALNQRIPVYVKRAKKNDYVVRRNDQIKQLVAELFAGIKPKKVKEAKVILLKRPKNDAEFIINVCADALFPFTGFSQEELRKHLKNLEKKNPGTLQKVIDITIGDRQTRRDRAPRGYEYGYPFTFELTNDYGIYRDLERHRMLTQQRQLLNPYLGYNLPQEIIDAGLEDQVKKAFKLSARLYEAMKEALGPAIAQYAVCFGYNVRYTMGMNLREVQHFTELRSAPQGHINYRRVAQQMAKMMPPEFQKMLQFVDYGDHYWARGDSEARQRQKERLLDEKYGK
ncbi:FAD-dependent thymidylate synthase [Candidatus Gracilibacteria bacterium]|nr:FAD-dependent thymidylate synthase [Candidatus Gracilibacteria bacterium]